MKYKNRFTPEAVISRVQVSVGSDFLTQAAFNISGPFFIKIKKCLLT